MKTRYYFVIAFFFIIMMPSIVSAATITVDDGGGQDHTTIQAAVNAANDSDTILVYPGTYVENVDVNKELTIISQSGNPDDTNVQANNSNDHIFSVTRDNVTISKFNITGATGFGRAGIFLDGVLNNTISGNNLSNNRVGIFLEQSSNSNVLNNNTASNNVNGIFLRFSNSNILNNNTASNNADGIFLTGSSNNVLKNNNVSDNDRGILLAGSSNNNMLTNNNALDNENGIVLFTPGNNNKLNSNIICNNSAYGVQLLNNNNTIYNNFFNNTNNTLISAVSTGNVWNVTNSSGPNVIGGPFLGGNYWAHPNGTGFSQTCADANNDGFCDSQFDIDSNNTDYLPLTINASIDIEKSTNGFDADVAPGPGIQFGQTVTWTYNVINNGNVILNNITVMDDKLGEITCPNSTLQPGESMICTVTGAAVLGQYSNSGNVTAVYGGVVSCNGGSIINDSDPSHYYGFKPSKGGLPYTPVPTGAPLITAGMLGIVLVIYIVRKQK